MNQSFPVTRQEILQAIRSQVEPLPYVLAMWEGGAPAFDRTDEWSDIDLQIVAADDRVDETLAEVERAILQISPIDLRYELPKPTWHGHTQAFYRLKDAGPFLLIDLVVMKLSAQERFLTPEIHGEAVIHFDKTGIVQTPHLDQDSHRKALISRLQTVCLLFDLFQSMTTKELNRKNWIEAFAFYQAYTIRPLVEVLGMLYRPARSNFGTRYVYYDFPMEISKRLERFYFVSSPENLWELRAEAERWFWETTRSVEDRLNQ